MNLCLFHVNVNDATRFGGDLHITCFRPPPAKFGWSQFGGLVRQKSNPPGMVGLASQLMHKLDVGGGTVNLTLSWPLAATLQSSRNLPREPKTRLEP
jgi:hypothetical protein